MIKTLLIDDEPLARMVLKEYLATFPQIEVIGECTDGFEGIKAIQELQPDLLFLDIQMPRLNGFEMLEILEAPPGVIFTTAYDEFAIRAFDAQAIDYLLKPFSKDRFDKAVNRWLDARNHARLASDAPGLQQKSFGYPASRNRIVVKTGGKIRIIPVSEVHYLEASDDYVRVVTSDGNFLKNQTLGYFEQYLDPGQFVRVHRSFMIQLSEITRIEPYEKESQLAILKSGARIPVSKSGYQKLKSLLGL